MKTPTLCGLLTLLLPLGLALANPSPGDAKLRGKVRFDGERPMKKPLPVDPAAAKGCCPEGEKVDAADPTLLIAEDGALANVVVTIDVPGAKLVVPEQPLTVDQRKCIFEPHILVVPAGSKVVFLNSDGVTHNVHTYSAKNEQINKTTAPGGKEELLLTRGDKVNVRCDYHPWMSSWVYVTETPHYAITKADGTFEIAGVPPGTYSASFWHEKLGRVKQDVTIKPDGTSDAVEVKLAEKKKAEKKG